MNQKDFLKVVRALVSRFHGDTWIDYDIGPSIVICLLEEFPEIDRNAILDVLEQEKAVWWEPEFRLEVEKFFGPRAFIFADIPEGRRYWNASRRELVDGLAEATYFDDEKSAKEASERESGPLGQDKAEFVGIVRIEYPNWTVCENPYP